MKSFNYHQKYPKEKLDAPAGDKNLTRRLWSYVRPYRIWIAGAIFLLIISKLIEVAAPIALGYAAQEILTHADADSTIKQGMLQSIAFFCALIIGFLIVGYVLDAFNILIKNWVGQRSIYKLRVDVYAHIQHLPLKYYDQHSIGSLMTRTIHDVDQVNQMLTESIVPLIGNLFLFGGIVVGIVIVDWRLALAGVIFMPLVYLLTSHFRRYQRQCYEQVRSIVSAMNTFVQEHLMGAFTIRNFGLEKKEREQFEEINADHCNANMETIDNFAFFIAGIDFLQAAFLIFVFAILAMTLQPGAEFQAGKFFTLSLYALMLFRPLADLAERYNVLQSAMAASARIFHVMDQPEEPQRESGESLKEVRTIEFRNVWFAYEKENWILKDVSFAIGKGESVALVGMTGEGKTTVISLLLQFYTHQKGEIFINGREIKEYSLPSLREQFSLVLQDPVIFSGTVRENICLYKKEIADDTLKQTLRDLGMEEFIRRFPKGLDEPLTERGKTLSLGEMQLISLARAVVSNRSMLVLDEATANIDTVTEKIIQQALKTVLMHKTALVIAHRLSTIRDVDRILVMHLGKIAEEGTHLQLIKQNGIYEKLYRLQFQNI